MVTFCLLRSRPTVKVQITRMTRLLGVSPRFRQRPCSGAGCRNYSACLRDSASDSARGLGAVTTRRVSVTPPATLLGGWAPLPLGVSP